MPALGKVANILNSRELVINIGSDNGVRRGMKFKVLADTPTEIKDPDTDDVIGLIDREKVRVQAIEVQDRIAICRTYETVRVGGTGGFSAVSRYLEQMNQPARDVPITLKAGDESYLPDLPESQSYVKRGDRVTEIIETRADNAP